MSEYSVCGYDMDLLHDRMLTIAKEVDRICRELGLKCSLYGGSIIGAIRHNGFIPWDHDIDMAMPRHDYDRLLSYMKENPSDILFFSDYHSERRYPNSWCKVRLKGTIFLEKELESLTELENGVFIDLHPIDNIIPPLLKAQVHLTQFWSCVGKVKSHIYRGTTRHKVVYSLFSWLPYEVINAFRDFTMKLFKHIHTKYVYKISHPNNGIYPIPRDTFEDLIEKDFEGYMFFIPRDYDSFLKKRYGNYWEIPPESEIKECCTSIVQCKL